MKYRVFVPARTSCIYEVEATNEDDAKEQIASGDFDAIDYDVMEEDMDTNYWDVEETDE